MYTKVCQRSVTEKTVRVHSYPSEMVHSQHTRTNHLLLYQTPCYFICITVFAYSILYARLWYHPVWFVTHTHLHAHAPHQGNMPQVDTFLHYSDT